MPLRNGELRICKRCGFMLVAHRREGEWESRYAPSDWLDQCQDPAPVSPMLCLFRQDAGASGLGAQQKSEKSSGG